MVIKGRARGQSTLLILAMVLLTGCLTNQRVVKSALANEFADFAERVVEVSASYQAAYDAGLITDAQAEEWNAYLERVKKQFSRLVTRFDLATPDDLEGIASDLAVMRAQLERRALPPMPPTPAKPLAPGAPRVITL